MNRAQYLREMYAAVYDESLREELIDEAEGSYGQTPKANLRYSNLARKGNKEAAKHANRTDTRESPTERETRIRRTKMTQDDRDRRRGAYEYGHDAYDPEEMDPPSGPGGMPKGKKLTRQRKTGVSEESFYEARDGYGDDSKFKQDTDAKSFRPGKDVPKVKKFGRISRAMPASISGHATRVISANTRAAGGDPGAPRSQKIATSKKMVKKDGKWVKESYDIVLSHLLDEGYAESQEAAIAIMANMSGDWIESIVEEQRPLPISKMSKQARRKAFNAASETHSDETGIGLVASGDKTAKQIRTMARVGGKPVKSHIKKGYEQGRQYDPYYQELNSRNPSRNKYS